MLFFESVFRSTLIDIARSRDKVSRCQPTVTQPRLTLSTSTFSPEGRLFQVEYSLEAIKLGSTAIGVSKATIQSFYVALTFFRRLRPHMVSFLVSRNESHLLY